MTRDDKVLLLQKLFQQLSNCGIETFGPTENGYRWTCEDNAIAQKLANNLIDHVRVLGLDIARFPYRFQPEGGGTLVIEPVDD
ncbi:MAG: hypothetical protein AABP62_24825 [Planctomycetota bacterium]